MALTPDQEQEINDSRGQTQETRRPTVAALEEVLFQAAPVLDHGFVRLVDYMGDDAAVVQAARVSYGAGTRHMREDRGLLRYLMRHAHTTPFEMCEIKLHVKLPIFIARQWIRHRTANVNELSGRYSVLDREFYIPAPENLARQSVSNRQGRGEVLSAEQAELVRDLLRADSEAAHDRYESLMSEDSPDDIATGGGSGLARELARMSLSLNYYTQWYWKVDLHNLLHFLRLRMDPHAQFEIRAYCDAIAALVARWVPLTWEAFCDYQANALSLSAGALDAVRRMLAGEAVDAESCGLSKREWDELMVSLGRPVG
jgi:thymidylate synthase (FAD)